MVDRARVSGDDERGRVLLRLARRTLEEELGAASGPSPPSSPWLEEPAATFVTLRRGGELRGCIGTLNPHRSLREDVCHNARAAAFRDPRFPPLAAAELPELVIRVSVLSSLAEIEATSEEELLAGLRPGTDGLVFAAGPHRGTFLPEVWTGLPAPRDFLRQLRRKAGLAEDYWGSDVQVWRYTVDSWEEEEGRPAGR